MCFLELQLTRKASGKLGRFILDALLRQDGFSVTVIARESSKANYNDGATVVRVSDAYPKDEMLAAFHGQDAVIVMFPFLSNGEHHRKIMDAAAEASVKHFIPNHWSSNAELPSVREGSERTDALDKDIEYLRTKEDSGMIWTAIIPGIFFDM